MCTAQLDPILRHLRKLATVGERTDQQLLDAFAARRDEAAFTALVARHGPMVLRVCRRALGHEQDAEDAFQATFLVLARDTGLIRKREALADWLHGVAYRTAMKAKRSAARRRAREQHRGAAASRPTASPLWDEVQETLDDEVRKLPERFRSAFVLCVLEGKSGPEAAAALGCKEGTVSSRLTRARQQLRRQLSRRGIKLTALLAALAVAEGTRKAAVAGPLMRSTIRYGLLVAADATAAGQIPTQIAALAAGVTRAMFLSKAKIATFVLLTGCFLAGIGALARRALAAPQAESKALVSAAAEEPAPNQKPAAADEKESLTYAGRVVGPDGKPVAGAKLYLTLAWYYTKRTAPSPAAATTGADGRFRFTVPKAKFGEQASVVAATASGLGVTWVDVWPGSNAEDLTLQPVPDDVPVTGQVVDLEGKPVQGATIRVRQVLAVAKEDLGPWLEAVKAKKGQSSQLEFQHFTQRLTCTEVPELSQKIATDAEGRFRLTGIGRNRLIVAQIDGPTIACQQLRILTRAGESIVAPESPGVRVIGISPSETTYHGASFKHVAAATKPIIGVVRDRDTKEPLAGVTIKSYKMANNPIHGVDWVETTTDDQGRYRLNGMPKGTDNKILLAPRDNQPYLHIHAGVPDSPGFDPVTVDLEVKRGVWIEGKITDKVTGKPLQCQVQYYTPLDNPNLPDHPGYDGTMQPFQASREDGTYRIVGLPGPGLVVVQHGGDYLRSTERDDAEGAKTHHLVVAPFHLFAMSTSAIARIDPVKGALQVTRDVALDPGETFHGKLVGPDGMPVSGALSYGLTADAGWERPALETAEFTVRAFSPRRPRPILFRHIDKGLVGVLEPPADASKPVTVRLQPGATVTGRVVDADGRPRANVELNVSIRARRDWSDGYSLPKKARTDANGRFRLDTLLPGYQYELYDREGNFNFGDGLRSGETKDLGDVPLKRAGE
jgi:RNA polymerase sigma factor (sigma-70 family)